MKAIGYSTAGPIDADDALVAFDAPEPTVGPRDLLVEVRGVSMNPVDVKVRAGMRPEGTRILGFDAAGVVRQIGQEVSLFRPGDEVFYAGDLTRPGTNAALHAVDERIVGKKPRSMSYADAAGMPLTTITAWEMLFDSFGIREGEGANDAILVIGGAGGVGSILIQLAKKLTSLTVVATASRDDTRAWVDKMGADHVINHRRPLAEEMRSLGIAPRYVAALTHTDQHFPGIIELTKPRGHIGVIDDPKALDIVPLKRKALSVSWEFMFARPMFQTADMDAQNKLLNRASSLLDEGILISTVTHHGGAMSVDSLTAAHARQETGTAIGKTVLDGF